MYTSIDPILEIKDETQKIIALGEFCNQRYKNWTETERLINAIEELESQVMNGGFSQYFHNVDGDQWDDVLIGLDKIGALKSKKLLEQAYTVFPDSTPSTIREKNQKIIDNLSTEQIDFLNSLDEEFMAYEDNIGHLVILYAEKNRNDFGKV